nr:unnamed protein product [Spirometra erinaceieuropaei]
MGSPLSGFIAEAVLQKVETKVFETYRPKFWARYVDDTFVIMKREMVQPFHNVLNSVSPDIQFTMEAESNNELPFLDVLVHRNPNGHLKTTVYRKAANTRQILSYHSKHPLSHKRSCVRTLYKRADTHCSEPDDKRSELRHLQRLFMANGYPRNFIERNRQPVPSRSPVTERPKVWRALPYIDGVSEAVSRLLRPLGIGIAHRPESTIRHLVMRPKTPLPPGETTNVIYRIQCSSCEINYIGETGKRLQTRVKEHMRAVRRMDQLSLVAEHCANSGHTFAFQSAEILGRGNDRVTRETIEAWHTSTNSINRCVALPEAYQALRTQLREQANKRGLRGQRNPITAGSMGDANAAALQLGSGDGAIATTVATPTCPAGEKTDARSNISGPDEGASVTATYPAGENVGCRGALKKIASRVRELRSTGDTNAAALQLGSGEGAIVTTVATPTCPAGEKTDGRSNRNGPEEGASVTATHPAGENTGRHEVAKKIASLGREVRSMRTRAMTASARMPAPDERQPQEQPTGTQHCSSSSKLERRKLQEKFHEMRAYLYTIFLDLTKAFDMVSREGLWGIDKKFCGSSPFTNMIRQLHDGMMVRVTVGGAISDAFAVINGVKQGCVRAPTLFSLMFSVILMEAYRDERLGIPTTYMANGHLFKNKRMRTIMRLFTATLYDLLFDDDCALNTTAKESIRRNMYLFDVSCAHFGLNINKDKH